MYMRWSQDERPEWRVSLRRAARMLAPSANAPERELALSLLQTQGTRSPQVSLPVGGVAVTMTVKAEGERDAVVGALQLLAVAARRVDGLWSRPNAVDLA